MKPAIDHEFQAAVKEFLSGLDHLKLAYTVAIQTPEGDAIVSLSGDSNLCKRMIEIQTKRLNLSIANSVERTVVN